MAAQPSSSEATTATSTTSDGPVLAVISKRLRAFRKKYRRIIELEKSLSQGKTLSKEQQDVLRSKPAVLTRMEQLEELRQPLSAALGEELSLALQKTQPPQSCQQDNVVKDLLNLMYFGNLFDVKHPDVIRSLMFTRSLERGCFVTCNYVPDDSPDMISHMHLDLISAFQEMMISRPLNSTLSHQNALDECLEHANRWIQNSDQTIHPSSKITYAFLRETLNKLMASHYFTAPPQMEVPGGVTDAVAVAPEQYQATEENAANHEEYETVEHQPGNAEDLPKDELEPENLSEVVSSHPDQEQFHSGEGEYGYRKVDQQYIYRGGQKGGRGDGGHHKGYS